MSDLSQVEPKSRSQQKREHQAIQALGRTLVDAPEKLLAKLRLPEPIADAIKAGRKLQRGALQRHLRHLATLLEHADIADIQAQLTAAQAPDREVVRRLHLLEAWREKLMREGDQAVTVLFQSNRALDAKHLRQLVRTAQSDAVAANPRGARALFKYLSAQDLTLPLVDHR